MASSVAVSLMGSSMASSVPPAVEEVSEEGLPIITLEEVKNHFSLQDAWMVVYDRVYNVTSFLAEVCNLINNPRMFNGAIVDSAEKPYFPQKILLQ